MQEPQTWRQLLAQVIKDPQKKQAIISALNINQLTLSRWIQNTSKPREQNLSLLLHTLSEYRAQLLPLIQLEFPHFVDSTQEINEDSSEILSSVYAEVFHACATVSQSVRFRSLSDLILSHALKQLDPQNVGMEITVARCMPPRDSIVISLREVLGRGKTPWSRDVPERTMFLGAESLAGYAVKTGHSIAVQSREDGYNLFPANWVDGEESAAAYPILRANRAAGALIVSCTQRSYFSLARLSLLQNYAELMGVVFERDEFYDMDSIELRVMPNYDQQKKCFINLGQRISETVSRYTRQQQSMTLLQAEMLVWQEIEDELLKVTQT